VLLILCFILILRLWSWMQILMWFARDGIIIWIYSIERRLASTMTENDATDDRETPAEKNDGQAACRKEHPTDYAHRPLRLRWRHLAGRYHCAGYTPDDAGYG